MQFESPHVLAALCYTAVLAQLCLVIMSDIRHRMVANRLVAFIAITGMVSWLAGGLSWSLVASHVAIVAAASVPLLIAYGFRLMGGADLKLILAGTLWLTPVEVLVFVAVFSLLGAFVALTTIVSRRFAGMGTTVIRGSSSGPNDVPYAVAISLGLIVTLFARHTVV